MYNFEIFKCNLYKNPNNDLVVGNMCESLCNKRNMYEYYLNYRLIDCLNENTKINTNGQNNDRLANMYDEFKVVLIYEHNLELNKDKKTDSDLPKRIVLKSRKKYFLSYDALMDFDLKEKSIAEQLKFLTHHLKVIIKFY
jgi:hypothetical protein